MSDVNVVTIQGRLTKDPDLKFLDSGTGKVFFTVAVNSYRGGNERADFIPVSAYGTLAENIAKYMTKGSYLSITGKIESATYEREGERTFYVGVLAQNVNFHPSVNKNGNGNDIESEDVSEKKKSPTVNVDLGNEKQLADLMNETDDLLADDLEDAADKYFG